ncbi:MAG: hypothetical protein AMXMBFR6_00750 [Betaproteobacteria bacterium]
MARRERNVARHGQFGQQAQSAGFRRNPQQHAGTGAIRQEKTPTDNSWGFMMNSKTLTRWRTIRRGPPFVKLGKTVRYAMSDVLEFERNGLRKPVLRLLPTPDDEQAPDQPVRLLTIRDVAAELRFGPEGDDGRRNCRK